MPDGQRRIFSLVLTVLGLGLFVATSIAGRPATGASFFLLLVSAGLLFIAARIWPRSEQETPGEDGYPGWFHTRIVLMFGAILLLLGYGLWGMFSGSL